MPTPLSMDHYEAVGTGVGASPALKPLTDVEPLPSYANGSSVLEPVNASPVGLVDRLKLSVGNDAGKIGYLKQNFEDAVKSPDGDLLVKDQGLWHRVSPTHLGAPDAWEATKKIVGTFTPPLLRMAAGKAGVDVPGVSASDAAGLVADSAGGALNVAGGVGGAMLGAGVASVPLAGALGAASEGVRSSLGRLAGTYEATPEQQLKDIGWEGLLNSGGQAIALGVKPTLAVLSAAMKPYSQSATNYAKETMATLWGHATGAGKWSVRRLMDDPEAIMPKVESALKTIGNTVSPDEAIGVAKDQQLKIVRTMANETKSALQAQYRSDSARLLGSVGDDFSVDAGGLVRNVQQKMAEAGYGEFVSTKSARSAVVPIGEQMGAAEAGPKVFKLYSPEQMAQKMGTDVGQLPKIMGENTRSAMEEMVSLTNQYAKAPILKGKTGAQQLVKFKQAAGETFSDLLSGTDTPDAMKRAVAGVRQDLEDGVGQAFANHSEGAYNAYSQMNERYSASKDAVDMLGNAVRRGTEENLIPQLVSKAGSNRSLKDEALTAANLLGPKGHAMMQALNDWEASKSFFNFVPKSLDGNSATTVGKLAGMVTQQSNPRAVASQIAYGSKALDFLQGLGPKNIRSFLANDQAVGAFSQSLMQAYGGEEQNIEALLKQAGVKQ